MKTALEICAEVVTNRSVESLQTETEVISIRINTEEKRWTHELNDPTNHLLVWNSSLIFYTKSYIRLFKKNNENDTRISKHLNNIMPPLLSGFWLDAYEYFVKNWTLNLFYSRGNRDDIMKRYVETSEKLTKIKNEVRITELLLSVSKWNLSSASPPPPLLQTIPL